jgi:hypothetical protein
MLNIRSFRLYTLAAVTLLAGCGGPSGPVCAPVTGRVSFQGKPLAEAMVVLHRIGGDVQGNQKPMAYTDTDGAFALTTFSHNDGAPPGDYAITIELRTPKLVGEETVRDGPNLLPPRFAKPESTDLKFTVVEGDNVIPTIEIPGS